RTSPIRSSTHAFGLNREAPMTTVALPQSPPREEAAETVVLRPGQLAWRRFRKHRMAMVALGGLCLLMLYLSLGGLFMRGLCAPINTYVTGEAYANCNDTGLKLQAPSRAHPFGTDTIGRDILARTIYGGEISLAIGVLPRIGEGTLGRVGRA